MRLKGINIFEQHAEKIALVVFGVFAVAIFVMQFGLFGTPNAVDVGQVKGVSPDRVASVVQAQAERVQSQMESIPDDEELPSVPSYAETVGAFLERRAVPAGETSIALVERWSGATPIAGGGETIVDMGENERYHEVAVPAPTGLILAQHASTVDPFVPAQVPEAAAYLPQDQPYDKRFVSVQFQFDVPGLLASLNLIPEDVAVRPIPRSWWQGTVELLDVVVEAQRRQPDGTWGPTEVLPPMPGRFSLRERLAGSGERGPGELRDVLALEAANRGTIRRPRPYRTISGPEWMWPGLVSERRSALGDIQRITELVNERKRLLAQIDRLQRLIEEREERQRRRDERDRERGTGGGGGGVPPGGGRSDGGDETWPGDWPRVPRHWYAQFGGQSVPQDSTAETEQIARLRAEIAEIEAELAGMGLDPEGTPLAPAEPPVFTESLDSLTAGANQQAITLWGHDLGVEPGVEYRYRAQVWVTNPFFGRQALPESQRSLAEPLAVASGWSEWSDPIEVYENRAMFVTAGSPSVMLLGGQGSRNASATVEMYEFFYGYWRRATSELAPGDVVAGDAEMPESELPRFEIERTAEGRWLVSGRSVLLESMQIEIPAVLVDVVEVVSGRDLVAYLGWLGDGRIGSWAVGEVEDGFFGFDVRSSAISGLTAVVREPNPSEGQERRPSGPIGSGTRDDGAGDDPSAPFVPPSRRERN